MIKSSMRAEWLAVVSVKEEEIVLECRDGELLRGHLWQAPDVRPVSTVIINPATGVLARYYHRYARFLATAGFRVITYDYRGMGASRSGPLRGCGYRWREWGEQDFDAVLRFVLSQDWTGSIQVIGHSIGGFLPGFSPDSNRIDRMLTVGAQYAYWRDYPQRHRRRLLWKWHVVMPALTFALGYFPGRRLGWLEDLPAGVAYEWSFRGKRMESSYPRGERMALLARFGAITAQILAVGVSDDQIASPRAIERALNYYTGTARTHVLLTPPDFDTQEIGHFGLFHERYRGSFWQQSLQWLEKAQNPWPFAEITEAAMAPTRLAVGSFGWFKRAG